MSRIKTPSFWYGRKPGLCAFLLWPLSLAYRFASGIFRPGVSIRVTRPVVCVGNVTAGGSGKTPVVQSLVSILGDMGRKPAVLLRGYGGRLKGPALVSANHGVLDVGDEALVHARQGPVWVSADRPAGAQAAIDTGANVVVMDDGFQNPSLFKDVSFLVVDGMSGLGNGFLLPAGPCRESLPSALARADAVVFLGEDKTGLLQQIDRPVFKARMAADAGLISGQPVFAFAGIGRPEKFRDALVSAGLEVKGFEAFADHHVYTDADMRRLAAAAGNSMLVTTEKDFVRIPVACAGHVRAVPARLVWDDEAALRRFLAERLA